MKVRTQELIGPALNWAVANIEKVPVIIGEDLRLWEDLGEGARGNEVNFEALFLPLLERKRIEVSPKERYSARVSSGWQASLLEGTQDKKALYMEGPTALVAVLRCHVASELGDVVEVPDELMSFADATKELARAKPRI